MGHAELIALYRAVTSRSDLTGKRYFGLLLSRFPCTACQNSLRVFCGMWNVELVIFAAGTNGSVRLARVSGVRFTRM